MCGRLNILDDPFNALISDVLGIRFHADSNQDLRPTQTVQVIIASHQPDSYQQISSQWGIQPAWARQLIINAKAETVREKATFKNAIATHRCLVPCAGWYEWRDEGQPRKQKYLFRHAEQQPLWMAGIYYPHQAEEGHETKQYQPKPPQLVTLTTQASEPCLPYHNRMPLLIQAEEIAYWLSASPDQLTPLLEEQVNLPIDIRTA